MQIIGHRGAAGLAPENTKLALIKAAEHRVDEIEVDIRVTRDRIPVLAHDKKLTDASGKKLVISQSDYGILKQHKPDLTTLNEALTAAGGKLKLLLELKPGIDLEPVIAALKAALKDSYAPEKLNVCSFSLSILKQVKQQLPELQLIVNETWSGVRATHRARKLHTNRLNMDHRWLWTGYVTPLARRGMHIYAYTVNDPKRARHLAKIGVSGVITDYPDRFQAKG